jgi:hypothetical protein
MTCRKVTWVLPLLLVTSCVTGKPRVPLPSQDLGWPSDLHPPFHSVLVRTIPLDMGSPEGSSIVRLGDWDGDGQADIAVSAAALRDRWGSVFVFSCSDGRTLICDSKAELLPEERRGMRVIAAAGDVDGDGLADLAILSSADNEEGKLAAELKVLGAQSNDPIWSKKMDVSHGCSPVCLATLADIDGDGVAELGVGMPPWNGADQLGYVEVRSGRDGHLVLRVSGTHPGYKFGWEIARVDDEDGDGIEDLAILEPFHDWFTNILRSDDPGPQIEVHSSATGKLIREIESDTHESCSATPHLLRGGTDVDGDGVKDISLRSLRDDDTVDLLSGKSSRVLARLTSHPDPQGRTDWWFPSDMDFAPDVDGDGWKDMLLGQAGVGTDMGADYGAIYLQSTRTNELLLAVWGTEHDVELGQCIAWLGAVDDSRRPEFAALAVDGVRIWAIEGPSKP